MRVYSSGFIPNKGLRLRGFGNGSLLSRAARCPVACRKLPLITTLILLTPHSPTGTAPLLRRYRRGKPEKREEQESTQAGDGVDAVALPRLLSERVFSNVRNFAPCGATWPKAQMAVNKWLLHY